METMDGKSRAMSGLEAHLGYWLRRVSNAVSGGFSRSLQAKETSVAEWVLLIEISKRGQASPGELAAAVGLTRGAVSKVVDKLEEKRWVRMAGVEEDSRFRVLSLTRAGARALPVLAGVADTNDAFFFECLTAREKKMLRDLLMKVADHHGMQDVPTE